MIILDGKKVSGVLRLKMADELAAFARKGLRAPGLAVIMVGDDPASKVYARNKQIACVETGVAFFPRYLPDTATLPEILATIAELNEREDVDGIILQLPLPIGLDESACLEAIDPSKDVDGFHPLNMGRLALGLPGFVPCTPAGAMALLEYYDLSPAGKNVVVIGRSAIVGRPLALMLSGKKCNATVTVCHSRTRDLSAESLRAEYLFVAIGKANAISGAMIREGAVVVDIGINRTPSGLCGDVDFADARKKVSAITPVPGGIGPMTIAMLLRNTIAAWRGFMNI